MTPNEILEAVIEARRFLKRAEKVLAKKHEHPDQNIWASPDNAAVRRASLDLTKSLAAMRRPR